MAIATLVCEACGKTYEAFHRKHTRKYCSASCGQALHGKSACNYVSPTRHLSTSTAGALGELIAAADLMKKGYDVFRALSPSCGCDLIVLIDGNRVMRVEVRSGYRRQDGTPHFGRKDTDPCDVYAVVIHDNNEVIYVPALDVATEKGGRVC